VSIFDELGLDDPAVVDPTEALPPGQYKASVYECKIVDNKNKPGKKNVEITYKVTNEDSPYKGKTIKEWKSANPDDDPQTKGWLKNRLNSLGAKKGDGPGELVGKAVVIEVKQNGEYTNVNKVVLLDASGGVAATSVAASANPDW
jgi:hypothetical protein